MQKKKVKKIVAVIISIILIVYLAMLFDTNNLMKEVRNAFLWETESSDTIGRPIDRYNYITFADNNSLGKANLSLTRFFVFHNFHDGYIWAYYSYEAYTPEGEIITGSWRIRTTWKIHKEDGKLEIIKIIEAP